MNEYRDRQKLMEPLSQTSNKYPGTNIITARK